MDEVAAIVPGDGSADVGADRDIILRLQGGGLHYISKFNPFYLPLHYVLLFPTGQEGWHLDIPLIAVGRCPHHSKKVTQTLWYAYCLHTCPSQIEPSNIFKARRLFQQLVCDAWASIDQCNLTWVANNQVRLRADIYKGLQDRLAQDGSAQDLGQVGRVILPSTHKGGPCHMHQLLQDSLATCREYKKPDLFLTTTANGTWPEITESLFPGMCLLFLMLYV